MNLLKILNIGMPFYGEYCTEITMIIFLRVFLNQIKRMSIWGFRLFVLVESLLSCENKILLSNKLYMSSLSQHMSQLLSFGLKNYTINIKLSFILSMSFQFTK